MNRLSFLRFQALTLLLLAACGGSKSDDAAPVTSPTTTSPTNPPSFGSSDAGLADVVDTCRTLNIGILGKPGENDSSNFQVWLGNAGTSTTRVLTGDNDPITSAVLAPFDVVVLDHLLHEPGDAEVTAFKNWVTSGKGVVSMTGYLNATEVDFRANPLISVFGVHYIGDHYLNGPIGHFVDHPTVRGLTSITFLGGYVVAEIPSVTATKTALGTIPAGTGAYAVELGSARAFVWGDEWIQFDSEWTTLPEVKQLWVQVFGWLAPTACKLRPPA